MAKEEFGVLRGNQDYDLWGIKSGNGTTDLQIVGLGNASDGSAQAWTVTTGNQSPVLVTPTETTPKVFLMTLEDDGYVLTGTNPTASSSSHYIVGGLPMYITLLPGEKISVLNTTLHISKCR